MSWSEGQRPVPGSQKDSVLVASAAYGAHRQALCTTTSTDITGSNTTGLALRAASLNAMETQFMRFLRLTCELAKGSFTPLGLWLFHFDSPAL